MKIFSLRHVTFAFLFLTLKSDCIFASDSIENEEHKIFFTSNAPFSISNASSLISSDIERNTLTPEEDEVGSPRTRGIIKKSIYVHNCSHLALPITALTASINLESRMVSAMVHNLAFLMNAYSLLSVSMNVTEFKLFKQLFNSPQEKFCITKFYNLCAFSLLCASSLLSNKQFLYYSDSTDSLIIGIDLITLSVIFLNSLLISNQKLCPSTFETDILPMM